MTKYHSLHTQQAELARQLSEVRQQISALGLQQSALKKQRSGAGAETLSSLQHKIELNKKTIVSLEEQRNSLKFQLCTYLPLEVLQTRFKMVDDNLTTRRTEYNKLAKEQTLIRQQLGSVHQQPKSSELQSQKQRNCLVLRKFNQKVVPLKQRYAVLHELVFQATKAQ